MIYALLLLALWALGVFALYQLFALSAYRFSGKRKDRFLRLFSHVTDQKRVAYCLACAFVLSILYLGTDALITLLLQNTLALWNMPIKLLCGCGVWVIVFFLYRNFVLPMHLRVCKGMKEEE